MGSQKHFKEAPEDQQPEERKLEDGEEIQEDEFPHMKVLKVSQQEEKTRIDQLDIGLLNYNFKCVNGIFRDKSMHLSHAETGTKIGSLVEENEDEQLPGPPLEQANFKIEAAGLHPEHCHIQFYKAANYYTIKDLSHKHIGDDFVDGVSGTWVTVPTNVVSELEWMNLHDEENYKH